MQSSLERVLSVNGSQADAAPLLGSCLGGCSDHQLNAFWRREEQASLLLRAWRRAQMSSTLEEAYQRKDRLHAPLGKVVRTEGMLAFLAVTDYIHRFCRSSERVSSQTPRNTGKRRNLS